MERIRWKSAANGICETGYSERVAAYGCNQWHKTRYSYTLTNLERNGQFLSGFVVQTYADDVQPIVNQGLYVGRMGTHLDAFSGGTWYRFGNDVFGTDVVPGSSKTVELESDEPPGIVECKVHGGPMRMVGSGEEIPVELEGLLLGYSSWPAGYTIGPNENFGSYGSVERYRAIQERVDQIVASGWLHKRLAYEYRRILGQDTVDKDALAETLGKHKEERLVSDEFIDLLIEQQ